MACDFTIAAQEAVFGEPELMFGAGIVTPLLPWLTSPKQANIDVRSAEGNMQAAPALAADRVATRPDVFLAMRDASVKMLVETTKTIPIVLGVGIDPLGSAMVASLPQAGGRPNAVPLPTA